MEKKKIENLHDLREDMGLSQRDFSIELEVPLRTVQEWEQGRRKPPEYVTKLAIKLVEAQRENKRLHDMLDRLVAYSELLNKQKEDEGSNE